MKKKELFRAIAFMIVLAMVLFVLNDLFRKDFTKVVDKSRMVDRFNTYKELEKDTVDAVMIGTSGIDRYWIASKGYEEYGLTVYPLSTSRQSSWLTLSVVKEAFINQNPKLIVLDIRPYVVDYNKKFSYYEAPVRYLADIPSLSLGNKLEVIRRSLKALKDIYPEEDIDELSFYYSFIKYHSRWEEEDIVSNITRDYPDFGYMGFHMVKSTTLRTFKEKKDAAGTEVRAELNPICEYYLYELLDYLAELDCEVLFVDTPHFRTSREAERANTICDIVEKYGFESLVCEVDENYDKVADFCDSGHTNYYGAEKFSKFLAEYLVENYEFPDRRNDEKCARWNGTYDSIKKTIAKWEEERAAKSTEK